MNSIKSAITTLVDRKDLDTDSTEEVMKEIMSGNATDAQIGSFLTALNMKGETPEEIAACARIMRQFASQINPSVRGRLVDTCGTGGDELNTFNISTTSMFVAAGAGVPIAKHGNRSVTSQSGSADVLERIGVNIDTSPEDVERFIENIGIGFMFAPRFHQAMKHVLGPRKEVELRSVFNVLGPLTNPAEAEGQVLGVYDRDLTEKMAKVLSKLDCKKALVVYGEPGLDEISILGKTHIAELDNGEIETYSVDPSDFDIPTTKPSKIAGGDAEQNAEIFLKVLKGKELGPKRNIVLINSAAAIYVSGETESFEEGLEIAENSIDSDRALEKTERLIEITDGETEKFRKLEESL